MSKSRIILIVALLVLAVGYVIVTQLQPPPLIIPDESIPAATAPAADLLAYLVKSWPTTEASLPIRPIYRDLSKNKVWGLPTAAQFIGNGMVLVRIEDDTDVHTVVLRLNGDRFAVAEIFKSVGSFAASDWQALVTKYGADTYPITTYAVELVREGRIVAFEHLTLVPENVFDQNYWNGK